MPRRSKLSHLDERGQARMVDVQAKAITQRLAIAEGRVRISAELRRQIEDDSLKKGNLLETARLAGIQAAKRTDELIPLCHSLPLEHVQVDLRLEGDVVLIRAQAATTAKTGVEMEALTAVAVAALTVIDMGKAVDPCMVIEGVRLIEKTGGRRGHFIASATRKEPRRK